MQRSKVQKKKVQVYIKGERERKKNKILRTDCW